MNDIEKILYPEIEPYNTSRLKVSDLHELSYEECGNPDGKPVVFLHGGPGGGYLPKYRRLFNPKKYRIILFDQRGCGKSTPHASLEENTTWDLVEDIEKIRKHLKISKWQVFGGSWGSTLSLAYAQTYPEVVTELVLRGIFCLREKEIRWFYQEGASKIFPDAWENYKKVIPADERDDFVKAYYKRLTSEDKNIRLEAAKAWSIWEGSTSELVPSSDDLSSSFGKEEFALAFARIECHYFTNGGFLQGKDLIENAHKIKDIPGVIVQGRYDVVCPTETAWELHQAWPEADFQIIKDAGHSTFEPGISKALIEATDKFSR